MGQIRIVLMKMPSTVRGFVVRCYEDEDYFTVIVNDALDENVKWETIEHELDHIKNDDFSSFLPATYLEALKHYAKTE